MNRDLISEMPDSYGDTRTDNDSQSVGSRPSLRAERKKLDQHSRGARLNFRKGSPLGHTIEELDDRGMIDGGDTVPSYEVSFKQRSRRPLEMRRRSSRLKGRADEKHSPKIINSFFHMVQVLIRHGLNFEDMLRQFDEEGSGVIEKEHFIRVCLSIGLPFGSRSLALVYNRYSVSNIHMDYEALLQELHQGVSSGPSEEYENDASTVLLEIRQMLRASAHAFKKSFDDVYRMFSRWDIAGSGTVTATQFLRVLSHLHIVFSEQDQDLIVELFDSDGEGRVDFDSLLTCCFQNDGEITQLDTAQSPFATKSYSYFGDDNMTNHSALSGGSVDNADTSVEKLDSSPDIHKADMIVDLSNGTLPPAASPDRRELTARSNSSATYRGGRVRPHTAGGDKRQHSDGASTGGSSRRESGHIDSDPAAAPRSGGQGDGNSYGSNPNNAVNVESPSSRARRMVRPMTAAPRVPLTVSVPRQQTRANSNQDNVSAIDEYVVDVLSDDDIIDGDEDDPMDLRSYEDRNEAQTHAATERVETPPQPRVQPQYNSVDEYNDHMKEDRDIRQFKSAAAAVIGSDAYRREDPPYEGDSLKVQQQRVRVTHNTEARYEEDVYTPQQQPAAIKKQSGPQYMEIHNQGQLDMRQESNGSYDRSNSPYNREAQQRDHANYISNLPRYNQNNYPSTYRAEPAAALKMLRRDIIHRHQKSGKTLYDIFRTFDVPGNRYFGANELQGTMMELALPIDEFQAAEMIKLLALDGEDRVCFSEFAVFITDPDFPALADRVERIVAENYEKQGREYQLKLYNITMHGPAGVHNSNSSGQEGAMNSATAITGFISKAAFEAALTELGVVASGNSKSDNQFHPLLNSVEVSRLCVRFDTHGRDLCSVAKFLRMVQNSSYWRKAEKNVILMEEAAEEAQTAREELEHHPNGYFSIGPPPGFILNDELIDMAEYLGIRVLSEPHMLHIVDAAVRAPVPEGWSIHTDKKGRNFFFHQRSGKSQWDHPADNEFRRVRDEARVTFSNHRLAGHQYGNQPDITDTIIVPEDNTRRQRPVSAKGGGSTRDQVISGGGFQHMSNRQMENQYHTHYSTPNSQPYSDLRHQSAERNIDDEPDITAIGDAVVQAMQGMDAAELLKILNKNGDLLAAMGVSKPNGNSPLDFTPQRSSGMNRHNSAPVMRHHASGMAVPLVPAMTASASAKKISPNGLGTVVGGSSQKKSSRPSSRHNGSGMFDRMQDDRERMQAKRTHNWTAPSAVDRALNIGKGFFGAGGNQGRSSNRGYDGVVSNEYDEVEIEHVDDKADKKPLHKTQHQSAEPNKNVVSAALPAKQAPALSNNCMRPKSGSGIRQKLPEATSASGESKKAVERPKSSARASRSSGTGNQASNTAPPPIKGPTIADIYGDKLLTRLDTLVARQHSP